MSKLLNRSRRTGFALLIALGLTILPGIIAPIVSDSFVSWTPNITEALADDISQGGGG